MESRPTPLKVAIDVHSHVSQRVTIQAYLRTNVRFIGKGSLKQIPILKPLKSLKINWDKSRTEIRHLLAQKKCSLRELQSILGLLQFACRVIVPGRVFLQNLYALTVGCSKPYHKIRLSRKEHKKIYYLATILRAFYRGISLQRTVFGSFSKTNLQTHQNLQEWMQCLVTPGFPLSGL